MRKELLEFAELASRYQHCVTVVTNATLIDNASALKLVESGVNHFQCSLDGPSPEVNDAVRGNKSFERAVKGILALDDVIRDVDGLSICITVNSINFAAIQETLAFLSDQGIYANIILERTINSGSAVSNDHLIPSDRQWIHASEQLCGSWLKWPRLAKMSMMGTPRFINWLEQTYSVVLNEAAYRCPVVEGGVLGRIFPDGKLFSCGQRDILEEARDSGLLLEEGQFALDILERPHSLDCMCESSKKLLSLQMGPSKHPLCEECEHRNICSSCPALNMMGYTSPPNVCLLIDELEGTTHNFSEQYIPLGNHENKGDELSIQKGVYWKELRDGGVLVFNPADKTELALSPESARVWRDIFSGCLVEAIKRKNTDSRTPLETSFFVESIIGALERCGILNDGRECAGCN